MVSGRSGLMALALANTIGKDADATD